jgi:hypothetical protein
MIERREERMLRLWKHKGNAIKNWRSRAWSIDPKVTNLTIIKADAQLTNLDSTPSEWDLPKLFQSYPQYFTAIADMEQFAL